MQYAVALLIGNVHVKNRYESQGREDFWSLLPLSCIYYNNQYYYYNSVTSHNPNDPLSLPLNSQIPTSTLVFLLDITHADLRYVFLPLLYLFSPFIILISKFTHNSRYIELLAEDLQFTKPGVTFFFYLRTRHSLTNQRSDSKSKFLLEKLTFSQLVKEFETMFSNQMFIKLYISTILSSVWARSRTRHIIPWISTLILSTAHTSVHSLPSTYQIACPFPTPYIVPKFQFQSVVLWNIP